MAFQMPKTFLLQDKKIFSSCRVNEVFFTLEGFIDVLFFILKNGQSPNPITDPLMPDDASRNKASSQPQQ